MSRTLCFCILFLCLERIAVTKNVSTTLRKARVKLRSHQIQRLLSLQPAVAEFVRTYEPRKTFKTTKSEYVQRPKRGTYKARNFSKSTKLTTVVSYKTRGGYPSRKERRKVIYMSLVNVFSGFDKEKKEFFTNTERPPEKASTCYMEALSCFMNRCLYDSYYCYTGIKYIKNLLARACMAQWLNTQKIIRILENCCGKRFKYVPAL